VSGGCWSTTLYRFSFFSFIRITLQTLFTYFAIDFAIMDSTLANSVIANLLEEIDRVKMENVAGQANCCPSDSTPYLASDYAAKGQKATVGSCEVYETGMPGSAAILLFPGKDAHFFRFGGLFTR
jgi:hypothetical protein